jgi:hypothetical protein
MQLALRTLLLLPQLLLVGASETMQEGGIGKRLCGHNRTRHRDEIVARTAVRPGPSSSLAHVHSLSSSHRTPHLARLSSALHSASQSCLPGDHLLHSPVSPGARSGCDGGQCAWCAWCGSGRSGGKNTWQGGRSTTRGVMARWRIGAVAHALLGDSRSLLSSWCCCCRGTGSHQHLVSLRRCDAHRTGHPRSCSASALLLLLLSRHGVLKHC